MCKMIYQASYIKWSLKNGSWIFLIMLSEYAASSTKIKQLKTDPASMDINFTNNTHVAKQKTKKKMFKKSTLL